MDQEDALDYDKVRDAILDKCEINEETYRLQFRGTEVGEDEWPKELYVRLQDLYHRWVQPQRKRLGRSSSWNKIFAWFRQISRCG